MANLPSLPCVPQSGPALGLVRALDSTPWDILSALADALADEGLEVYSLCYRWLARARRAPISYQEVWQWRDPQHSPLPLGHQLPQRVSNEFPNLPAQIGLRPHQAWSQAGCYERAAQAIWLCLTHAQYPIETVDDVHAVVHGVYIV